MNKAFEEIHFIIGRRFACFAQKLSYRRKQSQCDLLNESTGYFPATCSSAASNILSWNCRLKMTQQMQNLHLSQSKKHSAPSSPNAAKRLYRNLSEKLKGSHSSFDEAYFKTRTDRLSLRKTSVNFQGNEAMFEAVEQQDLDAVQLLLYQYTPEELDLNTPNSEGLTPLDIAIMTNNVPIARILLRTGARESPHSPEVPANACLMVTSSTSLTVSFQEPLSVNAAVVTRYKESSKLQTTGRKQSVSRSLKHLFHSSNKFVKTLKRGLYIAVIFYYKDNMLVTNEDQIPIVEIDDSHTSSITQDFLWFMKLSCMWEDIRWLRQSVPISMSSSTVLQTRQKMLAATAQLQNLLGTHNLGRLYYEPIKDRHGNILIVTIREVEMLYSFFNGKWMQISKLQSQRKSLSTPEEPTALDILLITIQDILSYHKRSHQRLSPGLYLGYLKLCSSVDQIKVLVTQKLPNILCHVKIRENNNISKEEWEWIQKLSGSESMESVDHNTECPMQLFFYELQAAVKDLLKQINIPLHQARNFRLYTQEVLEMGHNVSFLLLLPASDDVCTAPGQNNPYTPHSGFLNFPLQMFELGIVACFT
ncbi:Ankfn1 [Phodopus roborovskii]|uniref:Ankfn1 protein n=1 Tax=Phodopus roborovskii TaxID=109678 RepID=A0AAU9YLU2_PHORO|nr:Ankfn1 [Phodopus roborovskii]